MANLAGSRVREGREEGPSRTSPGPPQRASSVPQGHRPVLIVEPEKGVGVLLPGRSEGRRRDPFLEPEVLAAQVRTGTLKEVGGQFGFLAEAFQGIAARLREEVAGRG